MMYYKKLPKQELLKELFEYKNGKLYRKNIPKYSGAKIGTRAGSKAPRG